MAPGPPLWCNVMGLSLGGGGRGGDGSEAWEEQLPLPRQAKGNVFPGGMVVWEPVAFSIQEVPIVLWF